MKIVGCHLHARQQTLRWWTPRAASSSRRRMPTKGMEYASFMADLQDPVVVGIEASGGTLGKDPR
jgi:hypothetical protein